MKILLITPFFYENSIMGSVKYLLKLCNTLSEKNEVIVYTTKSKDISYISPFTAIWKEDFPNEEEKINKILVKRFNVENPNFFFRKINLSYVNLLPKIFNINLFKKFSDLTYYNKLGPTSKNMELEIFKKCKDFDLILLSYFPFKIVYSFSKIFKKNNINFAIIPLYHENDIYHNKMFLKESLKCSSAILELNQYSVNLFKKRYNPNSFNIKGYIDYPNPFSTKEINKFKRDNNLENKFVALMINRKEPGKKYPIVIDAINKIKDKDIVLLFIGEDIDKKKINSEKTLYLKNVNDKTVSLSYSSSDVLINMSMNESFGQVFLEAWHYKIPVIGNWNCNQIKSLIEDNEDGFLCKDALDLSEKILFLKNNPQIKKKMGINGNKKLNSEFSKEQFKKNIEGILKELLKIK